jgi:hypothetical protein
LTTLVLIFIAPEAQWSVAPRFSVGKEANNSQSARRGDAKRRIGHQNNIHAIARPSQPMRERVRRRGW